MAGPTTARRGAKKSPSGPPPSPPSGGRRFRLPRLRLRRPRRRSVIIIAVAAVLLGGFGAWALYGSDWLRLEEVHATGTEVLTPEEVVAAASAPMNAPLASVDTEAVRRRLLARLPRLKSVDVTRSWPHTLGLEVTERTPELLLQTNGKFVEVDGEGVRFATVSRAPKGVPLLEMTVSDSPSLHRFGTGRLLRAAVTVARDLPAVVRKDMRTVRMRSYDSITLELAGDRTVMWGSREQGAEKAKVLAGLMKAARDARHFDISVPSAPAVSGS
ncbi:MULTISPECIES: cell division protein FtsQ/DivIB [Streptomyces]|uniref:Cell division protein FtsQ n=2 Tax=Streptomyces TaxID=1883 RepID=A0A2N8PLJ5_STRNR|nr:MULTISPECIES: FtsQ-type POTRA domain-containing protein [Streptomyces]PNE41907.1 cell division protein FtsQ [Streptomyces noursei]SHL96751.1 cell division protein FtsQ [Streptomyces yunnanensis]